MKEPTRCITCGSLCTIYSSGEGTDSYEPMQDADLCKALEAAQARVAELNGRCCGCCRMCAVEGDCPYDIDEKGGRCCQPGGECLHTTPQAGEQEGQGDG